MPLPWPGPTGCNDIQRTARVAGRFFRLTPSMIAAEIMTHPVLAIGPDAPLLQAIRLMTEHRVSGLPVVDGTGRVLGECRQRLHDGGSRPCRRRLAGPLAQQGWLFAAVLDRDLALAVR